MRFLLVTCALLAAVQQTAAAQAFQARPLTTTVTVPFRLDSQDELVRGFVFGDYAALLDWRVSIVANSWTRSARLAGYSTLNRRLSQDTCVETRDPRPDLPCSSVPAADRDRLGYRWRPSGVWGSLFANQLNRIGTPQWLQLGSTPPASNASLQNPGTELQFVSGQTIPFDVSTPWRGLTMGTPRHEDTGFVIDRIQLIPSSPPTQGDTWEPTTGPHRRVMGVLRGGTDGGEDKYEFWVSSTQPAHVAIWGRSVPTGAGGTDQVFSGEVFARCGAKPTHSAYDYSRQFYWWGQHYPAFLRLRERPDGSTCTSGWYITIVNFTGIDFQFSALVGRNYPSREWINVKVGIEFAAGTAEQTWIRQALREAAWRIYGASSGSQVLHSYVFDPPGSCSNVTICWRNRPAGACQDGTAVVWPGTPIGSLHICLNTTPPSPGAAWPDHTPAATLVGHEFGHLLLGLQDEYWYSNDVARICGFSGFGIHRCSHSTMTISDPSRVNSLCTDRSHGSVIEHFTQLSSGGPLVRDGVARGPNTISECWGGAINQAGPWASSAWAQANGSGNVPTSHPLDVSADNFGFELFSKASFSPVLWDVGRTNP